MAVVRRAKPRRKRERAPELMRGKPSGLDGPRPALEGANKRLGEPPTPACGTALPVATGQPRRAAFDCVGQRVEQSAPVLGRATDGDSGGRDSRVRLSILPR